MKRFCPKCGITIEEGTFCSGCTPFSVKYTAPLIQVSEFNRTWHKGTWQQFQDLDQVITARVQDALKRKIVIKVPQFEFICRRKEKIDIICSANIDGKDVDLPVKLAYRQCDMGQKEKTDYFEGILQLRGPNDRAFEFIKKEMQIVSRKGIFVSKTVELANGGTDLYITNKNYIKLLAQKLHDRFGAIVNINAQLFSFDHLTSKDVYRINALVTFPKFDEGDVIHFIYDASKRTKAKEEFMLVGRLGRLAQGKDLLTGKQIGFESKYVEKAQKIELAKAKVISVEPDITILHPKTFQSEKITNSLIKEIEIDDEVWVALTTIGTFIVGILDEDECDDECNCEN